MSNVIIIDNVEHVYRSKENLMTAMLAVVEQAGGGVYDRSVKLYADFIIDHNKNEILKDRNTGIVGKIGE